MLLATDPDDVDAMHAAWCELPEHDEKGPCKMWTRMTERKNKERLKSLEL
jgi:hypothetical protein